MTLVIQAGSVWAAACEIKNGHICVSDEYGEGRVKSIALTMDDEEGKCGYWKGCSDSWTDCAEWDENWENCIREETYYEGCYEIKVYRLTPCYDDYQEFKRMFFEHCEMPADEVEVFDGSNMTWEARDCCWSYWNNLVKGYKLGWNVEGKFFGDSYNASGWSEVCLHETEDCWEVEPGVFDCMEGCDEWAVYIFYMYNFSWRSRRLWY